MSVFIVGQSALASFLKLLMLLIAFILILAASYYVTKWYAKSGFIKKQNNMEIIDTFSMGPNRQICIMRIGQKYIAVSVCKDQIRFLTEIPEDQLELTAQMPQVDGAPFKDVFRDMMRQQFPSGKKKEK